MSELGLETEPKSSKPPADKSYYLLKITTAGILVFSILIFTLAGFNSTFDNLLPGAIDWFFTKLNEILHYFFVPKGTTPTPAVTYNSKTFFVPVLIVIFSAIGVKNSIGKWALWICSREKEKGPLYSWLPNFLYSEYAVEKYKIANKNEELEKIQSDMQKAQQDNLLLRSYVTQLKEAVNITLRDRRLVHNLDNLIGKCYAMTDQILKKKDRDQDRLIRFLSQVCSEICSTTIDIQNNKHAYIFIRNFKDDKMELVGECRSGSNLSGVLKFEKDEGFVGKVWATGEEQLITNISTQANDVIVKKGERRYNSIAGVPLKHGDEIIGVVVVSSQQENEVSEEDYDNISKYLNIIQLALLIELSNLSPKGGDEYVSLVSLLQQTQVD